MSTLQESVEARRAAKPSDLGCIVAGSPTPTLALLIWEGRAWAFPWSHFIAASLADAPEGDTLELCFTGHLAVVAGLNLSQVFDDIAGFRVVGLRQLPASYRARLPGDAPFIHAISVRSRSEIQELPG